MLTPGVKYAMKVIFVIIVIIGLLASYIFTGAPQTVPESDLQENQQNFNFTGPESAPAVGAPTTPAGTGGPSTPPPVR